MAGLEGIDASTMEIIDALGGVEFRYDEDRVVRPLVRPTSFVPVRFGDEITMTRFGLPIGKRIITNARADRLEESPSWKSMLDGGRCLAAASYVVERHEDQSYRIQRTDGRLLVIPALRRVAHYAFASTGNEYDDPGHVQITAPANEFIGRIHGRFVVDLEPEEAAAWLDGDLSVLRPAPEDRYEMVPVDGAVWKGGSAEPTGPPVRAS